MFQRNVSFFFTRSALSDYHGGDGDICGIFQGKKLSNSSLSSIEIEIYPVVFN